MLKRSSICVCNFVEANNKEWATSEELFHGHVHNSKCLVISFMTKEGDLLIPAERAISSHLQKTP